MSRDRSARHRIEASLAATSIAATWCLACGPIAAPRPEPANSKVSGAPSTRTSGPVSGAPSVPVAPGKLELPPEDVLEQRVVGAYRKLSEGDAAGARAAFEELVSLFAAAGKRATPGLGRLDGTVVPGRTKAGFSVPTGHRGETWFFDLETGEPFAYAPGVELRRGAPALDASLFATADGRDLLGLFDPLSLRQVELPGTLIGLHPDGHRAYLFGDDCRVHEWSIEKGAVTADLAWHAKRPRAGDDTPRPECDAGQFEDAAVTADGKWLTTRFGRWSLATRAHVPLPFRWDAQRDYQPAVSPDGRYAARLIPNPGVPPENGAEASLLVLYDLDTGAWKRPVNPLPLIVNGRPLTFGGPPPRICVFDYGSHAFEVPSLREIPLDDPVFIPGNEDRISFGLDCQSAFIPPPKGHLDLQTKLASRVCEMAGFLIPIARCPAAQ